MFACCCAESAAPAEVHTEERHDGGDESPGDAKLGGAASTAAVSSSAGSKSSGMGQRDGSADAEEVTVGTGQKVVIHPVKKQEAPAKKPMTAPAVERARRTSAPMQCPLDEGIYLMYSSEMDSIYAQWSTSPEPSALAWLKPSVAVPRHKFKEDGKYYEGWIKFVCIANELPSKLMLLDNFGACGAPDVQVLQLASPGDASSAGTEYVAQPIGEYNALYDLKNIKAIAIVPVTSTLIPIGQPITPQKFLQMGQGEGGAQAINMR
ncbi:hypothetical protein cyc_00050 [Cyclospora cayetanensis]|uniref:Immune mapped protein 2 N-terminal domain-containing protein n=1 Tax=Cyclospora cayetanensis TaxID=88456 RepID=A0A1D3CVI2_9EIME|nr:hypothetical protein cyc_00050 [Cyclospora cayetanensis]